MYFGRSSAGFKDVGLALSSIFQIGSKSNENIGIGRPLNSMGRENPGRECDNMAKTKPPAETSATNSQAATESATQTDNARKKSVQKKAPRKGKGPGPQWTFPKNTLEDAIAIAKAIEDKHGGNAMKADLLAKAVGFNKPNDWRFDLLRRSGNFYGLVTGSGQHATVALDKIGQDVVAHWFSAGSPQRILAAFHHVDEFKKVDEFSGNKRIPENEYFLNTLTRQFNIPRDRVNVFAEVFRANVAFLRSFNVTTGTATSEAVAQSERFPSANPHPKGQRSSQACRASTAFVSFLIRAL